MDVTNKKISIAIFSKERVKNTQLLLKRLNIDAKITFDQQWTLPPYASEKILSNRYQILIEGQKDMKKFIEIIRSRHPDKNKRFQILINSIKS